MQLERARPEFLKWNQQAFYEILVDKTFINGQLVKEVGAIVK